MSRETDDFLRGLHGQDDNYDRGRFINWTRGFEPDDDEYADYRARDNDRGSDQNNQTSANGGGWRFWDRD